jgi:magnesium chelatase family protein
MTRRQVRKHCPLDQDGQLLIRQAMDALGFSARAYDRILKVARTIADLGASPAIVPRHVSQIHPPVAWRAINYRTHDRCLE